MRRRRTPEVIAGIIAADGSISRGDGFTSQKTGTGAYTITFAPGLRLISFTAMAVSGTAVMTGAPGTWTDRTVTLGVFTPNTLANIDAIISFVAVGVQQ